MRGTEFDIDKVNDLVIADAGGILLNGVAKAQITDMYNYDQSQIGTGQLSVGKPLAIVDDVRFMSSKPNIMFRLGDA